MKIAEFLAVFFACFSLTFLASCASHEQTKSTIKYYDPANVEQDYPRVQFLRAEGRGASALEAEENARLNLARIFSVRITGDQQSFRQIASIKTDASETVEVNYSMSDSVAQQTDQLIEGSEVVVGYDEFTQAYRALATLEKQPAAIRLKQQITQLDQQTRNSLEQTATPDRLDSLAHSYQAWQLQILADSRRKQLSIIQRKATLESIWPTYLLQQQVVSRLRQVSFYTSVINLNADFQQIIFSALAKTGLERLEDTDADYKMLITAKMEHPFYSDYWYWQTATLRFDIKNKTDNRVRGGWLWNIKASATEESLLSGRMKSSIQKRIERDMLMELLRLANKTIIDNK